jgi:anaerobic selenocysteine-containing dehydrogenase
VLDGLRREDLFTVVHEQFPTDTVSYADIALPATTELEHFDIHGSYGHFYVQASERAIAPLGEAKPNTEVFRLLARAMGFEPELFEASDEELAAQALKATEAATPPSPPFEGGARGGASAFEGIDLDRLRSNGPLRLNLPTDYAPFAGGGFGTPSCKCEFYSERLAKLGFDPLPTYIPPHEDPQTRPEMARRFPLQMVSPPAPSFLNSTFVNIASLREMAGEPSIEIHVADAQKRNLADGDRARVFNDRGGFRARVVISENVKPGVVVTQGIWWNKLTTDGVNCNATSSTRLTDLGAGATFFDNLVEVEREGQPCR